MWVYISKLNTSDQKVRNADLINGIGNIALILDILFLSRLQPRLIIATNVWGEGEYVCIGYKTKNI